MMDARNAKAAGSKRQAEVDQIQQNENIVHEPNNESLPWHDVADITLRAGGEKSYVVIRQFRSNQRLIIKINTNDSKVSKILLHAVSHYKISFFSDNAFEFSSLEGFYKFAEHADSRLYECLQSVIDKDNKVTDGELANAILQYFDKPDCKATDVLYNWLRQTGSIVKNNTDISYKTNIAQQKSGAFNPIADMEVDVYVEFTHDFLLGLIVSSERPDTERPALFKIREALYAVGASTMTLQKSLGVEPEDIYDILVDKYSPFSPENIEALKTYLNNALIDFEYSSERVLIVEPKKLWYQIPQYHELNPKDYSGEYVAQGTISEMYIIVSYVEDLILNVEFEDRISTSGYWHDNPNYPFTDISSRTVIVDQPAEIGHLLESLQITDKTPNSLMEKIKSLFTSQDSFIDYLDSHAIKYKIKRQ